MGSSRAGSKARKRPPSPNKRKLLIEAELVNVSRTIARMLRTRPRAVSIKRDLEGVAREALVEAAGRFDEKEGTSFSTFAEFRIRGAILDYMRSIDPMGRHYRDRIKKGLPVPPDVETRQVYTGEKAEELIKRSVADTTPEHLAVWGEVRDRIIDAIEDLPEREQLIMNLMFVEELTLKEIGQVIGVTESRVCQIWNQIARKMAVMLMDLRSMISDKPGQKP